MVNEISTGTRVQAGTMLKECGGAPAVCFSWDAEAASASASRKLRVRTHWLAAPTSRAVRRLASLLLLLGSICRRNLLSLRELPACSHDAPVAAAVAIKDDCMSHSPS